MRQQAPKRRFPEHHIVDGADPPIIGCQQVSPMLRVACNLLDSIGGANPTQTHQLGEKCCESVPTQLCTQHHWYAVEFVVNPAAEMLGFRQIEALPAAVLEPNSETERTCAVIAADVLSLFDIAAYKISRNAPLVPHAPFALQHVSLRPSLH